MNGALAANTAGETSRQARSPEEDFVLGIDVGGTKLALATADLDGNRRFDDELPTLADQGAPAVISRLLEAARGLIARTCATGGGELLAVGAVSPGIVMDDRVLLAPNNPGWSTLALAAELRAGLGISRVVVDTDAKTAVLAEARWGTLPGVDNGAFLNLGTGVSLAAIVHGRVLRGAHGAAGEIGYHLIGRPSEAAFAEGHAPLEEHVGGGPLGARVSALLGRPDGGNSPPGYRGPRLPVRRGDRVRAEGPRDDRHPGQRLVSRRPAPRSGSSDGARRPHPQPPSCRTRGG